MKHSGISQLTIDKQEQKLEQQLKEELGLNTNHSYWKPYLTHQKKKKKLDSYMFPFSFMVWIKRKSTSILCSKNIETFQLHLEI